jgi:hypothetical protein
VAGEVHRAAELVTQPLQRRPGVRDTPGRRAVHAHDIDPVAEHVGTVVEALQVVLVDERAQQVVRGREGESGGAGKLLGVGATFALGDDIEQPQSALHRLDEGRT